MKTVGIAMKILSFFLLLVFLLASCSNSANADKDIEAKLDKVYEALNAASLGLEYPPNQKVLDGCIKNNDKSCLKAYRSVQDAKKTILEAIGDDVLVPTVLCGNPCCTNYFKVTSSKPDAFPRWSVGTRETLSFAGSATSGVIKSLAVGIFEGTLN